MTSRLRKDAIWLSALLLAAAAIAPPLIHRIEEKRLARCKENLRNIEYACIMYSVLPGRFPKRLDLLIPQYLENIPACPSAGKDSYSAGYLVASNPDRFTICCTGHNHSALGIPPNYPQYNDDKGLVER